MKTLFIGISGASGAGKSTLCEALLNEYPETIGLIQLDDYFKKEQDVPVFNGIQNWDSPDSLRLDKLYQDMLEFQAGASVMVDTKNLKLNPDYAHTEKRIAVEFDPKPIMLIEGFLVLFDERVRKILATSVWLDIPQEESYKRRVHFKDDEYYSKVLLPMNEKYVAPTKKFAEHLLDVSVMSKEEVFKKVNQMILGLKK